MQVELLSILRCPEDHTPLRVASGPLVEEINAAIRAERLTDRGGKPVVQAIDSGLIRAAGDVLYPIIDQIPVLLVDESIALDQLGGSFARR